MDLHESTTINDSDGKIQITRVAGGWIYEMIRGTSHSIGRHPVFIPFNNEFQENIYYSYEKINKKKKTGNL